MAVRGEKEREMMGERLGRDGGIERLGAGEGRDSPFARAAHSSQLTHSLLSLVFAPLIVDCLIIPSLAFSLFVECFILCINLNLVFVMLVLRINIVRYTSEFAR
jgi:hypothetical protein